MREVNPFAWLAAIGVAAFAVALVVVGVLIVGPMAVQRMTEMGSLGTLIMGAGGMAGIMIAWSLVDALGDGLAAMGAAAGFSLREKKGKAAKAEADADVTRAQTWTPGATNGKVPADSEFTGEW